MKISKFEDFARWFLTSSGTKHLLTITDKSSHFRELTADGESTVFRWGENRPNLVRDLGPVIPALATSDISLWVIGEWHRVVCDDGVERKAFMSINGAFVINESNATMYRLLEDNTVRTSHLEPLFRVIEDLGIIGE